MSKKFFINNLNTYIGSCLFEEIRNDINEDGSQNDDSNVIFGTYVDKDSSEKPEGVRKMLKRSKPRLAMKYISEWDVIIYDLHSGNPRDLDLALGAFEKYKFEEDAESKVLILISSVAVWKNTEAQLVEIRPEGETKKENEGEGEGDQKEDIKVEGEGEKDEAEKEEQKKESDSQNGEGEANPQGEGEDGEGEVEVEKEEVPPPEYKNVPYTEEQYSMRNPPEEYEKIKELEDKILELKKQGLKTYVICSGIVYGNGETETVFNDRFRQAWLQEPEYLPYIEDGENCIPTIHAVDLVRLVKKVYEVKPEQQYIFAIDNTEDRRQKSLIQAISKGIGTGKIESKDYQQDDIVSLTHRLDVADKPNSTLTIDLNLKPSRLMVTPTGEEDVEPVEFPWHCEKGLSVNIDKVKAEFCKVNNLVPIKIFINGPPLSGKTFFGDKLAEHYNVPLINLKTLIPELEAYELKEDEENELIDAIRDWKKKNNKKRYPDELLYQMVQYRLTQNDCQNRGFVLDGFPRTYKDAQGVFFHTLKKKEKPKKPEGEGEGDAGKEPAEGEEEEEDPDKYKPKFMKQIYPESVIFLQADDEFLQEKAKKLPKEIMKDSHYYENHMDRRMATWNEGNTNADYRYGLEPGKPSLTTARFFQEKETELLEIDAKTDNFELFEAMRVYIERHGRPFNYLRSLEKLNDERHEYINKKEDELNKKKEVEESNLASRKEKELQRLAKLAEERYPGIKKHVKDLEKVKDQKAREFLMKNIVPILSEGMIEVAKIAPIDPIDYLAEYIFKKSNELHKSEHKK